jgi:phosphoserine phosphatase
VEGLIERIEPAPRRGATWECSGRMTPETLLLTFWPTASVDGDTPQSDSSGVLVVQRESTRNRPWPGAFVKLERHAGATPMLPQHAYWLAPPSDPHLVDACSSIAVLDLDNTLAHGWLIQRWVHELCDAGLSDSSESALQLDELFDEYGADPDYGHDHLARQAATVYASAMSGISVVDVASLARRVVGGYLGQGGSVFPSTQPLLTGLRERGIRPVLVTGAPGEIAVPLAEAIGIHSVFPLTLGQRDGRFTGDIEVNHGLASTKRQVCTALIENSECDVLVAVGDSEGDRPMWEAAQVSVRVGGPSGAADVSVSGLNLTAALKPAFWEYIPQASWIDEIGWTGMSHRSRG